MCVVSQITDYGQRIWPNPRVASSPWTLPYPVEDSGYPIPASAPTAPIFTTDDLKKVKEFLELIEKAKEFDKLADQPDCPDPQKAQYIKDLETRVEELERTVNERKSTDGPEFLQD